MDPIHEAFEFIDVILACCLSFVQHSSHSKVSGGIEAWWGSCSLLPGMRLGPVVRKVVVRLVQLVVAEVKSEFQEHTMFLNSSG